MTCDAERNITEITAVKTVRRALTSAQQFQFPVLIIGDAGVGKTTALRLVARETSAAYAEVNQSIKTPKAVYRLILSAYKVHTDREFVSDLAQTCYNALGSRVFREVSPLFVDEYQNLPPAMLRELLHVQEQCGLTLVLAGNKERLSRTASSAGALDQIESRIGMRFRIHKPSPADCENIAIDYNVEGRDAYEALEAYGSRTSIRQLIHLLRVCARVTEGKGSIKLPHIKHSVQVIHEDVAKPLRMITPPTAV